MKLKRSEMLKISETFPQITLFSFKTRDTTKVLNKLIMIKTKILEHVPSSFPR